MLYKIETVIDDILELSDNLRLEDKQEMEGLGYPDPLLPLIESFHNSDECWTIKVKENNKVAGVYGVNDGLIWLMATPEILKGKIQFLRNCRQEVERLNTKYPVLYNIVDSRNDLHLKWLQFCNFEFVSVVSINEINYMTIRRFK